jgi:hypothetical protein
VAGPLYCASQLDQHATRSEIPKETGSPTVTVADFPSGGYRYIPAVFQYSGGVSALPGFTIRRYRFRSPVPLLDGFDRIRNIIRSADRPLTSFCACELRSPAPFTEEEFRTFNEKYVVALERWGLFEGGRNPVARSNVCPEVGPPPEPSFHAFSFTVAAADPAPTFVISGSAEATEGAPSYAERTIRRGETTPGAMREKAQFVLNEMERRLELLGFYWHDTTVTQVYTVHDLYPFLADEILRRGAASAGLVWHYCRPPVRELEYEMDCRSVSLEYVV